MASAGETAEDRIVSTALPVIRFLCLGKWLNLEYEDRVSEALLFLILMLRSMPLTTGHFFKDYWDHFSEYMDRLNRKTPSLRFGHFSLDAIIAGTKDDGINGYGILRSRLSDFSKLSVVEFLSSLTDDERKIVLLRMSGYGKREASRVLDVSVYQLEKALSDIRRHYKDWSSEE